MKQTIAILAAGAGGMYCGSCMRDNALAAALLRGGHDVTLVPLYTPLKTDQPAVSIDRIFYGGLNVFLQHASRLFRHTPRAVDWLFDRPWLLHAVSGVAATTDPSKLGPLTISVLQGEAGPEAKELRRLIDFLRDQVRPDVVLLPNAMFLGLARPLRRELGVAVVCELSGEDLFLDHLAQPHRDHAVEIVRQLAGEVDRFAAASASYADHMANYLGVPRDRIDVVYPGVAAGDFPPPPETPPDRPFAVGYLARVCPEKGLDRLVEAMIRLRHRREMKCVELRAAGWLGAADREWFDQAVVGRIVDSPLAGGFSYLGEVDRPGKIQFLRDIDLLCVPTAVPEPKGIYVLEALAAGVPVVQPATGAFPELLAATGGGVLVGPDDTAALADALAELLDDRPRRQMLAASGRAAVGAMFTEEHMARAMLEVFGKARAARRPSGGDGSAQ